MEPWFLSKMDGYFQLPRGQRAEYLDRVVDTILSWRGADRLQPAAAETPEGPGERGLVAALLNRADDWQADANPQRRSQVREFLWAVKVRWWLRKEL